MINELNDAMQEGKGKELLREVTNGLISYTKTQFKPVEIYFDRYGYPEAECHKEEHEKFVSTV